MAGSGGVGEDAWGGILKKGPWTPAEDAILLDYVNRHGEGNWNALHKYSGLCRCGKSCRLRWANHLRPNLKKSAFTSEEERSILELHAKLGNKWARMAAQRKKSSLKSPMRSLSLVVAVEMKAFLPFLQGHMYFLLQIGTITMLKWGRNSVLSLIPWLPC